MKLSIILFLFCLIQQNNATMINKKTVTEFDLNRYLGKWYEIARFPHSFEKDLVGVTATYNLLDNGYKKSFKGELNKAIGKAKTTEQPGKLKVSFFLFFYSAYNILELDSDYQWSLVGSTSSDYLWILSRSPHMDNDLYNSIILKAKARGYKTSKLVLVPQKE